MWQCNSSFSDELYHYGVLGMKWGVRRYQNYDGSYTKKGLSRYNQAVEGYKKAKQAKDAARVAYKSGRIQKNEYKNVKKTASKAAKNVKDAHKHLRNDYNADKGKARYANGETMTTNNNKSVIATAGALIVGNVIRNYTLNNFVKDYSNAITVGEVATVSAINAVTNHKNKQLRAYYGHSSYKS